MKKVISIAVALVLCLSIFAGCGAKEVNLADLMDKMNSEYSVDATKYETKDDMYKYYNINADDIKQFAAEVGKSDTDSKNTEVVLVEATDSDAASRVETALTNRYNSICAFLLSNSASLRISSGVSILSLAFEISERIDFTGKVFSAILSCFKISLTSFF